MILVKSPLRISLGGGGTDLPSYYSRFGGALVAAAIQKYVYVSVTRPFRTGIFLKYSRHESVQRTSEIRHPIIREALRLFAPDTAQIEITTLADIPSGTGLGSSGSFTVALLKALGLYFGVEFTSERLAELACEIEIEKLSEPIGKQDQYASAIGGITDYVFLPDGRVSYEKLTLNPEIVKNFENSLCLFFTGFTRSAGTILSDQKKKSELDDTNMFDNLHAVKSLGRESLSAIVDGDFQRLGSLMHQHWNKKRVRSRGMTNEHIDLMYKEGIKAGAIGGKLVGAGGGGFLLFIADVKDRVMLAEKMDSLGLPEVKLKFDFDGVCTVLHEH